MTKYFLSAFTVLMLSACIESFDIKTDNSPPVIVIYGYLTDEPDYHTVKVSASSPYFDTTPNAGVSGARVKIVSSNNHTIDFLENDTIPGLYITRSKVAGTPGLTYSLSVETDFDGDGIRETYSAVSTMPEVADVDSVEIKGLVMMGNRFYIMNLYGQDPPAEDYYLGLYKVNDSTVLNGINRLSPMSDEAFNGQYINGLMIERFWDVREKEKHDREDNDNAYVRTYLSPGDTVTFSLCRIEKGYFDFIIQCQNEMNGENPFFGGPASNITTNISGGGVGYFTTYALSTTKAVVPDDEN
jgi:hypothetical protein